MKTLSGTYAEDDRKLEYVGRAFYYQGKWYDGSGNIELVEDGDVLLVCGKGTWFALYREKFPVNLG